MPVDYSLVRSTESQEEDIYDVEKSPLQSTYRFLFVKQALSPRFWLNLWAIFNTIFTPIREDGAERYVNTRYKPDKIFQSPPTEEVDAAWHNWLRDNDHLVRVSGYKAKELGLPEAVQLYKDPGYHAYGLGVYHQMHCLSRLRKSFYPDRYYPNASQHEILHHTNHCFDVLRQAILCHGDISLVYWWNQNYTHIDETGARHYTEEYLRRTPEERVTGSFVTWDSEVQCRDMHAINAWVKGNKIDDNDYGGQVVD
ncbi:hypothetical protein N7463_009279 [Penicillium fimorum]|uniref:Uncharacterized protein n=1 Tax=Penicillium fimorum TaxID=1882269 RepID=A0A9W9XQG2_9EURO|nr:hypothetical protein N7463_009279 [Penicillium fimorum]